MSWNPYGEEAKKKFRSFKSRLTRALNRKDWHAVIAVANDFENFYDAHPPVPDDWNRWARAKRDAEQELARQRQAIDRF